MVTKILGWSAVLGIVAASAFVVGCGKGEADDTDQGGSAVIPEKGFTAECTLQTKTKDGKTINGYLDGRFKLNDKGAVTSGTQLFVSIGSKGRKDFTLNVKSGTVTDADNEVFDFVASQNVQAAGYDFDVMDVTVHYDGVKKKAEIDSVVTGKDTYTASCTFKDEQGVDRTNKVGK
jgi:hypothetical protein